MSEGPKWTVHISADSGKQVTDWADRGGPGLELASHAQHCIDQLELLGPGANNTKPLGGIPGLSRIRSDDVRVYFDTLPGRHIAIGQIEHKKGEHPTKVYQQIAKRVANYRAAVQADLAGSKGHTR